MKNKHIPSFLAGALFAVLLFGGAALFNTNSHAQPGANNSGRYQLAAGTQNVVFCIDTQTGQVWTKLPGAGARWDKYGNPAHD